MVKLTLLANGSQIDEFELTRERLSIGRRPDNDIHLDDLAVSGYHAQVIAADGDNLIEDLKSTNGVCVNSKPIARQVLKDGDVIDIGAYQIKYCSEEAPQHPPHRPAPRDSRAVVSNDPTEHGGDSSEAIHACLQILNGAKAGSELKLSKRMTTLGKPGVVVAAINQRPNGFFIIEVENNGGGREISRLNGEPFSTKAKPLQNHDIVEIAGVKMEFYLS